MSLLPRLPCGVVGILYKQAGKHLPRPCEPPCHFAPPDGTLSPPKPKISQIHRVPAAVVWLLMGTCWQISHRSVKFSIPAHQVNPPAVCWKPEPISARAAQMSSKRATNPEHLEGISFSACAWRDCAARVRLVPCLPPALVLLSTCLRAAPCRHGACGRDFQMSGSSSVP